MQKTIETPSVENLTRMLLERGVCVAVAGKTLVNKNPRVLFFLYFFRLGSGYSVGCQL